MKIPNQTCDCNSSLQLLCSSSVSPPRLVPQAETSAVNTLPPSFTQPYSPDVEEQHWATSVLVLTPFFPQVLRLTVKLKLAWCRDLSRSVVSTYSTLSHNTTAFISSENVVLKSPLHFLRYPNTRSNVYELLLEWSKCNVLKKNAC